MNSTPEMQDGDLFNEFIKIMIKLKEKKYISQECLKNGKPNIPTSMWDIEEVINTLLLYISNKNTIENFINSAPKKFIPILIIYIMISTECDHTTEKIIKILSHGMSQSGFYKNFIILNQGFYRWSWYNFIRSEFKY